MKKWRPRNQRHKKSAVYSLASLRVRLAFSHFRLCPIAPRPAHEHSQKKQRLKKGASLQGCEFKMSIAKSYAHAMVEKLDQSCQKQALSQSQKTNGNIAACALPDVYCNLKNLRNAKYWFYEQWSSFNCPRSLRTAKAAALELSSTSYGLSCRWCFWTNGDCWHFFY